MGLGSIGSRHLRISRKLLPHADIRVLSRKVESIVPQYSNGCFGSLSDAILFAPDIAVIATPSSFHLETAQAFADIGTHLLVEKPLSDSIAGVGRLLQTVERNRSVLFTGYNLRFSTSLQYFRGVIEDGVIGKVLSVRCEVGQYLPSWRPDKDYRLGVSANRELGGGVLLELSHELDFLRWIFGEVDWVRATLSRQSDLEIDVEDSAHLIIGFIPKVPSRPLVATVNLDFVRHDTTRMCVAIGEAGSVRWNGLTGEVALYGQDTDEWHALYAHYSEQDETYLAEWREFLECVDESRTPGVTGEDGLRVLEIIEAARSSASTGRQISVSMTPLRLGFNT